MATDLELIALEKLRKILLDINDRILENEDTPERQVQYVLPFIKTKIENSIHIVDAITKHT